MSVILGRQPEILEALKSIRRSARVIEEKTNLAEELFWNSLNVSGQHYNRLTTMAARNQAELICQSRFQELDSILDQVQIVLTEHVPQPEGPPVINPPTKVVFVDKGYSPAPDRVSFYCERIRERTLAAERLVKVVTGNEDVEVEALKALMGDLTDTDADRGFVFRIGVHFSDVYTHMFPQAQIETAYVFPLVFNVNIEDKNTLILSVQNANSGAKQTFWGWANEPEGTGTPIEGVSDGDYTDGGIALQVTDFVRIYKLGGMPDEDPYKSLLAWQDWNVDEFRDVAYDSIVTAISDSGDTQKANLELLGTYAKPDYGSNPAAVETPNIVGAGTNLPRPGSSFLLRRTQRDMPS